MANKETACQPQQTVKKNVAVTSKHDTNKYYTENIFHIFFALNNELLNLIFYCRIYIYNETIGECVLDVAYFRLVTEKYHTQGKVKFKLAKKIL